ncbi:MAG: DHA2 family efflux MFS transporter permease subunit [Chlamydiae bacterium]|nr:DHA2 family efflux MFS transporter permease subunit [Chlamydiota bacterium]
MTKTSLSKWTRILLFISLALSTFMMVLDYSIANVSIPYISGDLGVSNEQGTYVITSFAVGNAIGLAMTGWLTKRVGDVKLLTISILLFTFFSWTCGLSFNLTMLIISRFIQGLVAGPVIPLSQSILIQEGTPESRAKDLSIWSTIIVTGPVVGPVLGGYISDWYIWSWIFYINIPVGIFCAISIWLIMKNRGSEKQKVPTDLYGIVLLVIGVSCLQIFLDKGQQWDWINSNTIRILFIGTVVSFSFLVIREFWFKTPFLNLRLLKIPTFSLSIIALAISYAIYFGTIVLVPLWLQEYMGYNAEWAGIAVCSLGIAPIFLSTFTPKITKRIGNVSTLLIGFAIFGFACFFSSFFDTDVDLFYISLGRFIFGIGFLYYITPLIGLSVRDIPEKELPNATGFFHFTRAMVGGIGTSVFVTLWERRTIFHHERIGATLTPFNPLLPEKQDATSLALLNNSVDQQAAMLALNDAFYLMGWLFVGLILILVFWKWKNRKVDVSSHKHHAIISSE